MSIFQRDVSSIPDIILLTYGESDLAIDSKIKTEMIHSLLLDSGKYESPKGIASLRNIIALKENQNHQSNYDENDVLVTNGATEGLFLALSSLINPGDEVLLMIPTYPTYEAIIRYIGGKITYVKCLDDFDIDINDFKKKINSKVKVAIFNYPNNPTGKILSKDAVLEIKRLLLKYQVPFILDNVYDEILFVDKEIYLNDFKELKDLQIITNSLSKSKRIPGWRLGYLIGPKKLIELATKLHQEINICLPPFMMEGMKYALNSNPEISYYKKNLHYCLTQLQKMKLKTVTPQGGFYLCFSIDEFHMSSYDFCSYMAKEFHVGLMPCSFFKLEGYVRICIACSLDKLTLGIKRLKKGIKKLKEK